MCVRNMKYVRKGKPTEDFAKGAAKKTSSEFEKGTCVQTLKPSCLSNNHNNKALVVYSILFTHLTLAGTL